MTPGGAAPRRTGQCVRARRARARAGVGVFTRLRSAPSRRSSAAPGPTCSRSGRRDTGGPEPGLPGWPPRAAPVPPRVSVGARQSPAQPSPSRPATAPPSGGRPRLSPSRRRRRRVSAGRVFVNAKLPGRGRDGTRGGSAGGRFPRSPAAVGPVAYRRRSAPRRGGTPGGKMGGGAGTGGAAPACASGQSRHPPRLAFIPAGVPWSSPLPPPPRAVRVRPPGPTPRGDPPAARPPARAELPVLPIPPPRPLPPPGRAARRHEMLYRLNDYSGDLTNKRPHRSLRNCIPPPDPEAASAPTPAPATGPTATPPPRSPRGRRDRAPRGRSPVPGPGLLVIPARAAGTAHTRAAPAGHGGLGNPHGERAPPPAPSRPRRTRLCPAQRPTRDGRRVSASPAAPTRVPPVRPARGVA